MKHTFTRREIIRALRTEPLRPGAWISTLSDSRGRTCTVCAVGAVLRQKFGQVSTLLAIRLTKYNPRSGYSNPTAFEHDIAARLRDREYFAALSAFFEGPYNEHNRNFVRMTSSKKRQELIDFVKKNFPKSFEVEA